MPEQEIEHQSAKEKLIALRDKMNTQEHIDVGDLIYIVKSLLNAVVED